MVHTTPTLHNQKISPQYNRVNSFKEHNCVYILSRNNPSRYHCRICRKRHDCGVNCQLAVDRYVDDRIVKICPITAIEVSNDLDLRQHLTFQKNSDKLNAPHWETEHPNGKLGVYLNHSLQTLFGKKCYTVAKPNNTYLKVRIERAATSLLMKLLIGRERKKLNEIIYKNIKTKYYPNIKALVKEETPLYIVFNTVVHYMAREQHNLFNGYDSQTEYASLHKKLVHVAYKILSSNYIFTTLKTVKYTELFLFCILDSVRNGIEIEQLYYQSYLMRVLPDSKYVMPYLNIPFGIKTSIMDELLLYLQVSTANRSKP